MRKTSAYILFLFCAMMWCGNAKAQNAITFWKNSMSTVVDNPDKISFKDTSNPHNTGNASTYWKDGQAFVVEAPDSIFFWNYERVYTEFEPDKIADPSESEQYVMQLSSDEDTAPITSYSDEDSLIYDALAQEVIDILSFEESQPYEMPRKKGKDEDAKGKKVVNNSGQNIFSNLKIEQQNWDCKDWGKTHYARHDEFKVGFKTVNENGKRMLLVVFFHKGGFPSFYKAYVKVGQLNSGKIAGSQNVYCGNDRAIVKICIDDFLDNFGCVNFFPLVINQESKARYYLNPIFIKANPIVAGDWNQKYFGYEFGKIDGVSAFYNKDSFAGRNQSVANDATYQCVELCARYLTRQFGCVRPSIGWGNANLWPDRRRNEINDKGVNKYIVFPNDGSKQVREGDVIVWTKGTYGHVAMVVKTTPNYISIAHQNGGAKATPIGTTLSIINGVIKDLKYDINNDKPTEKVSVLGWPITYFIRINSENENPISFTKSMRINTTNITFPDTDINGDERSETFTIQNTSPNGTLVITSFELSNNEVFSTDIAPCSIDPGKKQTFHVTFAPKRPNVFKGCLVIKSNADDNPTWTINLSGKGIGEIQHSTINVIPKCIDFGTVKKGVPDSKPFAVQNTGAYDLKFRVNQPTAPFRISEAGQVITVPAGKHHTMEVICDGLELGEVVENVFVKIASDATNRDEVTGITLSANGGFLPFQLSTTTLTLSTGSKGTVNITSGSGSYSIEKIESTGVVIASISENHISIEALKAGTVIITVKDNKTGQTASFTVTITDPTPTDIPAEPIDLGLPSGTLWASYNVGATKPEEYGKYYSWGEIEVRDQYYFTTYSLCDGTVSSCHDIGENISGTKYDVAHVKWGGEWCMPTKDDFMELVYNCEYKETTQNGVKGFQFTGPNGNYIFLPYTGYYWNTENEKAGREGSYWSATQTTSVNKAHEMSFKNGEMLWDCYINRFAGLTVRPVIHSTPTNEASITFQSAEILEVSSEPKYNGDGEYLFTWYTTKFKYVIKIDGADMIDYIQPIIFDNGTWTYNGGKSRVPGNGMYSVTTSMNYDNDANMNWATGYLITLKDGTTTYSTNILQFGGTPEYPTVTVGGSSPKMSKSKKVKKSSTSTGSIPTINNVEFEKLR